MSFATTGSDYRRVGPLRLMGWFLVALIAAVLVGGFLQQKGASYFAAQSEIENREKVTAVASRRASFRDVFFSAGCAGRKP